MPKTKAKPYEVVTFEVGVKNRQPYIIDADMWSFGSYSDGTATFMLRGDLVLVVAHQKWDYIKRVGTKVKEDEDGKKQ